MWSLKSVAITPIAPPVEDFLGGQSTFDISLASIGTAKYPLFKTANAQGRYIFRSGWSWNNDSTATRGFGQVNAPKVALFGDDIQVEYLGLI